MLVSNTTIYHVLSINMTILHMLSHNIPPRLITYQVRLVQTSITVTLVQVSGVVCLQTLTDT